jgi:hypothetical protein
VHNSARSLMHGTNVMIELPSVRQTGLVENSAKIISNNPMGFSRSLDDGSLTELVNSSMGFDIRLI